ncbi:TIGR01459 family HAD-type hydrolase [uncultured Sulfitobacter sp.]|uniref:TIGR01459 family HAD-type hydrolase n=1 Tax=uncultured Sulfitobacter sp. TaxID=191468 RepID=UPI0026301D56|nr:TIGR01459 family HAD-type hydrolase [uncultured Sulfitobacter sp.]
MQIIQNLIEIADRFDAIVLDQWGVLHDGTRPYLHAINTLETLHAKGIRLAVLSNSGKRSDPNAARIAAMGFPTHLFEQVMTSGEALYRDIAQGQLPYRTICPITRDTGDAENWSDGLGLTLTDDVEAADAILLMGLPDSAPTDAYQRTLAHAKKRNVPVLCTNPDRASPRAGGAIVVSPGALAHDHLVSGGDVRFYGKPHLPVFRAIETVLGVAPDRLLMVGDSLEHDIAGGAAAGWSTAFIRGGLHAHAFTQETGIAQAISDLARRDAAPLPTFTLAYLE